MEQKQLTQTAGDLPKSIDIRSARCIALAAKYRYGEESLTRTVERILERHDAQQQDDGAGDLKSEQPKA